VKEYHEKEYYLRKTKTRILSGFENFVNNEEFAHYEHMLRFPQCFK